MPGLRDTLRVSWDSSARALRNTRARHAIAYGHAPRSHPVHRGDPRRTQSTSVVGPFAEERHHSGHRVRQRAARDALHLALHVGAHAALEQVVVEDGDLHLEDLGEPGDCARDADVVRSVILYGGPGSGADVRGGEAGE